jgi:DNA-binding NarL/FixJ family response regulator
MEVARLVIEGHTNRSVAERLGLAEHTVSNYLFRMYDKLGVSNRVELVLHLLDAPQMNVGKTLSLAEPRRSPRKQPTVAD